ncbi:hypothetical protein NKH52_25435 [Mesorhizobium sp. M1066]|uniref:hypothetical protein n=1 Tax=unclassified Mesorhizobium TaxID=325217 RepID=UPI0033397AD8
MADKIVVMDNGRMDSQGLSVIETAEGVSLPVLPVVTWEPELDLGGWFPAFYPVPA